MHDDPESPQRTPKSSSSSAPSGTQALRVTFAADPAQADMAAPAEIPAPEPAADLVDADPEISPLPASLDAGNEVADAATLPIQDEAPDLAPASDMDFAAAPELNGAHSEDALASLEQVSILVEADVPPVINGDADPEPQPVSLFANGMNGETPDAYRQTTEELPEVVLETMSGTDATHERPAALYGQVSQNLGVLMDDARQDAARFGHKLMEFVQANVDSGMVLAKDYADARSVPDIFSVHAAYFKRQLDLMSRQSEELRALSRELASKNAERLQLRLKA